MPPLAAPPATCRSVNRCDVTSETMQPPSNARNSGRLSNAQLPCTADDPASHSYATAGRSITHISGEIAHAGTAALSGLESACLVCPGWSVFGGFINGRCLKRLYAKYHSYP